MKFIDPFEINLYPNKQVSTLLKENNMLKSKNKEIMVTAILVVLTFNAFLTYSLYKNKQLTQKIKLKDGN